MANSTVSYIILTWIDYCSDPSQSDIATSSSSYDLSFFSFIAVVPLFYHLLVQAIKSMPSHEQEEANTSLGMSQRIFSSQHPYCFSVLTHIMAKLSAGHLSAYSSDHFDNNDMIQRLMRGGYETMLFLMNCGYVTTPLQYIINTIETVDADIVRFILTRILGLQKPFSHIFLEKVLELLRKPCILKELLRRDNFTLLQQFLREIMAGQFTAMTGDGLSVETISLIDNSLPASVDDSPTNSSIAPLRLKYQAIAAKIQSVVDECKHNFKY
jgi:hypothetical protein